MEIAILIIAVVTLIGVSSNNHALAELDKRLAEWEASSKAKNSEENSDGNQRS